MTFLGSSPRRGIATLTAVLSGLLGGMTLAAPAQADDPRITVTGTVVCDKTAGMWLLTFSATNNSDQIATIVDRVGLDYSSPTIAPQATVTYHFSVPGSVTNALEGGVTVTWPGSDIEVNYPTTVEPPSGGCGVDTRVPPPNRCVTEAWLGLVRTPESPNGVLGLVRRLCPGLSAQGALVTYTVDSDGTQHRYDSQIVTMDNAHPTAHFSVAFPPCASAFYMVDGAEIFETIAKDADPYGGRKVRWDPPTPGAGDSCDGVPALTFTTRCDGTAKATVISTVDEMFTFTDRGEYTVTVKASAGVPLVVELPSAVGGEFYVRGDRGDGDDWLIALAKPNTCAPPLQATISSSSDCDTLKLDVHNPGTKPMVAYITTPGPDESEVTIQAGTTYSKSWDATRIKAVTVQAVDEVREIVYQRPGNCPFPPFKRLTGVGKWKITQPNNPISR